MINVFEPNVSQSDIESVREVLESKWLGKGAVTDRFELAFADFIGCSQNQVLSVNSCTEAAFILAEFLRAKKDVVLLPSMSFVGVANAFLSNGFDIHFLDVSSETLNSEINEVEKLVKKFGSRAVLVLNHFYCGPETLEEIALLCVNNGVILVEDSAGVLGAKRSGRSLGTFGDFGIWSFDAMKTITCGDGGMIYSKDPVVVEELKRRTYLGLKSESGYKNSNNPSQSKWWEFQISGPFSRSIMNDIASSLGLSQLERIDFTLAQRELTASQYHRVFEAEKMQIAPFNKVSLDRSPNYIFPIIVEGRRDSLAAYLKEHDVYTTFRYFPLHKVDYFNNFSKAELVNTQYIQDSLLLLPNHPNLTSDEISLIADLVVKYLNG